MDIEAPASKLDYRSIHYNPASSIAATRILDYITTLAYLTTFGILGVLIRNGMEHLFSPSIARVTDDSVAFIDLPANMLGSFFMGWLGVVLKQHIVTFSEHLSIGLTTGLLGSTTTFASWTQSAIKLMTKGYWVRGLCAYLFGMELSMMSFLIGIDSANVFLGFLERMAKPTTSSKQQPRYLELASFLMIGLSLWAVSCYLAINASGSRKQLWIACCLAPLGVWIRWWLTTFNGNGLEGNLKWFPTGTFAANMLACITEFILSALQFLVPSPRFALISRGVQFGFSGSLSTVSTLMAEIYGLHQGTEKWKAYAYATTSLLGASAIGLVTFSTVVWTKQESVLH